MSTLPWLFVSLLLFSLPALHRAKRQPGEGPKQASAPRPPPAAPSAAPAPPPAAKRPRGRTGPTAGEFASKDGHRCGWEISGESVVILLVSCSTGAEQKYSCRYRGRPDLCPAYHTKSSQYWKQLVGKLRKRPNACEGVKVLKVKSCKKAPADSHMKLVPPGGAEGGGGRAGGGGGGTTAAAEAKKTGKGGGGGGRKKGGSTGGGKAEGKKTEEGEEEKEKEKTLDDLAGLGDETMMSDMAPAQSYCADGWHSVCSFFVHFFEG